VPQDKDASEKTTMQLRERWPKRKYFTQNSRLARIYSPAAGFRLAGFDGTALHSPRYILAVDTLA
jgi:hypothetical protein